MAIADAYDAMTHDRPYKRAMDHESAVQELRRHAGTQFDPELVALFCDLFASQAPLPDPRVAALSVDAVPPPETVKSRRRRAKEAGSTPQIPLADGPDSAPETAAG